MKLEIPKRIMEIHARITELVKELACIRKREVAERQNVTNYQERIKKLDGLAEESLSGNTSRYEKFKTSTKKLSEQLAVSKEILGKLGSVRKPLEDERRTHKHNLPMLLSNWAWEFCRAVDAEKRPLIEAVMAAVEECLKDIEKTYQEFGVMFVPAKHLILFGLPEDFVSDFRKKKAQQAAAHKPVIESTHTSTEAPPAVEAVPESAVPVVPMNQAEGPVGQPPTPSLPIAEPFGEPEAETPTGAEPEADEPSPVLEPSVPAEPLVDEVLWGEPDCFVEREVG